MAARSAAQQTAIAVADDRDGHRVGARKVFGGAFRAAPLRARRGQHGLPAAGRAVAVPRVPVDQGARVSGDGGLVGRELRHDSPKLLEARDVFDAEGRLGLVHRGDVHREVRDAVVDAEQKRRRRRLIIHIFY